MKIFVFAALLVSGFLCTSCGETKGQSAARVAKERFDSLRNSLKESANSFEEKNKRLEREIKEKVEAEINRK